MLSRYLLTGLVALTLSACDRPAESPTGAVEVDAVVSADAGNSPSLPLSGIDSEGLDATVRAQDDFFEYANGGWLRSTEIPAEKSRYGSFDILADKAEEDLRDLVEELAALETVEAGSAAQKIRDYYTSYTDIETANMLGISAIQSDLDMIAAAQDHEDVYRLFGLLGMDGVLSPIGMFIFSDFQDANTNVVYLAESGLSLPDRDYYLEDDERFVQARTLLKNYVKTLFDLAGLPDGEAFSGQLLTLETRLAEVQWTREENRDRAKQYNPHSLDELEALSPDINWPVYLDASLLAGRDSYIVMQPSFFEAAGKIIAETDVPTWKHYLTYQVINSYAPALGDAFFTAWFDMYLKGLQGVEEPKPMWKRALASINGNLGELLGQLYVERHFKSEAKERMEAMIANLKEAFRISINELDWMSDETKQQALDKLSKFNAKVGYPDQWRDYSQLEIVEGDLVGNLKRATAFEYQRNLNKLDRPVDKSEWLMTPQTINAYYLPMWNEIVFPASILQPPFFNMAADDAVNYGAIGAVIGHEIGHGFDDQGRRFDGDGNLRDWWTEQDNALFLERKDKLAAQFNGYVVIDGLTINGEFTSGENIGDLGGLMIAYKAYRLSLDGKEAPVIDGWTGDQRFFLGYAQIWRDKQRPEEQKRRITVDPHSPARFRVNGGLVNVPEFYSAFGVQEGDGMYLAPAERVKIW